MNKIQQIRAEYESPTLLKQLVEMRRDEYRRVSQERQPDSIITASLAHSGKADYLLSPVPGSVVVFWAHEGSELISDLERAYAIGDEDALRRLSGVFAEAQENRPVVSIDEGFERLFAAPMYFDVVYGNKLLVSRLALPDGIDFGAVAFPYNGGDLDDARFSIVEYHASLDNTSNATLIVKVPPELTDIERFAVDAVPSDQSDLNIGHATLCPVACVAIAAIVIALITTAGIDEVMRDRLAEVTLTEETLKRLGPLASARELLSVRREIFEEHGF